MATNKITSPTAPNDAGAIARRAGEALLTAQVMSNAVGYLISQVMEDSEGEHEAPLQAMAACLEKMKALVNPATDEAFALAVQLGCMSGAASAEPGHAYVKATPGHTPQN